MKKLLTLVFALAMALPVAADKPEIDPSWANGQLVYMIGPHIIQNAIQTQPNLYAHSEELYLLVYPINPSGTDTDQKALPGGYAPNCNPCYHPGLPGVFAYHDHVLTGAPGQGKDGTAGVFKAPWKIIVLMYNPAVMNSVHPPFVPIKSASDIDAAEANGVFLPINSNLASGPNPYEIETGNVLICPLVSPHA
jgi:hypothetical protein